MELQEMNEDSCMAERSFSAQGRPVIGDREDCTDNATVSARSQRLAQVG